MDNDAIFKQFDDIEEKVDYLIGVCRTLESDKSDLKRKVETLEQELNERNDAHQHQVEVNTTIQSKIDGLLNKLNNYSELS